MKSIGTSPAIKPSTPAASRGISNASTITEKPKLRSHVGRGLQQLELDVSLYAPIRLRARTSGSSR